MVFETAKIALIETANKPTLHAKQYDTGLRQWKLEVVKNINGEPYIIPSTAIVNIQGRKPDNTIFDYSKAENLIEIRDNFITLTCQEQMAVVPGTVECQLKIIEADGRISTTTFYIDIAKSPVNADDIISESELNAYEKLGDEISDNAIKANQSASEAKETANQLQVKLDNYAGTIASYEGNTICFTTFNGSDLENPSLPEAVNQNTSTIAKVSDALDDTKQTVKDTSDKVSKNISNLETLTQILTETNKTVSDLVDHEGFKRITITVHDYEIIQNSDLFTKNDYPFACKIIMDGVTENTFVDISPVTYIPISPWAIQSVSGAIILLFATKPINDNTFNIYITITKDHEVSK